MQQLSSRLGGLTTGVGKLIESGMFLDDFRRFLDLGSSAARTPAPDPRAPRRPFGGLRVDGVSFSYPATGRRVLEDVSLEVKPGEVVALVGENGSGKTTLVKLICQLYGVDAGTIYWDGVDARQLPPYAVRDEITVLFQDYVKYHLSAFDNVVVGRPERASDKLAVSAAAARAGADIFLEALPHGYATRLGQQFYGGHELSIGQWQRLALARAFFRGGSFLILDEPTASLDPRAEARLFEQIRELAEGRSVLLVSHRFSTVRSADRIYVLEHGRVAEAGTHEDLLARGGSYAELFGLQAEADLVGSRLA
jgi:ATP-binding cassette subfamily B protein